MAEERNEGQSVEQAVNNPNMLTKEAAITRIREIASERGYGTYKVKYQGSIVARPSDLPEVVDMSQVEIMATHNQA